MPSWLPEWNISINSSSNLKNITLSNITITSGRTNIYNQPQASYCSFELINLNETALNLSINDSVTISLKNSSGTFIPIFGGFITDLNQSVIKSGPTGLDQIFSIIALGALARLPKALTDGVLAKDQDGDQIYTILSQILFNTWQQVPAATTWNGYDSTITWENAENNGLGEIDRPGNYDLDARSSSVTDIYSLVSALATSGLGYLYEDSQGRICYADSTHRTQYLVTNSFTDISANLALSSGIRTSTRSGDVRNKVTLKYKANQTNEVTASDNTSIGIYGELAQIISTTLDKAADATTQANFYLTLRAYPQPQLEAITFHLNNPQISNIIRDQFINVFMGWPIKLTDLPTNMSGGQYEGFVEGWTFRSGLNTLTLSLYLSPAAYSIQEMRWNSVGGLETWQTINPTLIWQNATIVA